MLEEKFFQSEKSYKLLSDEINILKMRFENISLKYTVKTSNLKKLYNNLISSFKQYGEFIIDLSEFNEEDDDKISEFLTNGFLLIKNNEKKYDDEIKKLKNEINLLNDDLLTKQSKCIYLLEEKNKLENDFKKKIEKRDLEFKQIMSMANIFEKLFNEIIKHSPEIYKQNLLELYELEAKNKEYVEKIIEKIDLFLKNEQEFKKEMENKIKVLDADKQQLVNLSKQFENEKKDKNIENNDGLMRKMSISSIREDFSGLFEHKENEIIAVILL